MTTRVAILDDYQNVALKLADWSKLGNDFEIKVFSEPVRRAPEDTIKALQRFDVISLMRERTAFPRKVIERLPDLKLLITTGARNASIDIAACAERGIVVCGTSGYGNPTTSIAFGLMLELARRIGWESARMKAGEPWQLTIGSDVEGATLGLLGLGKLGARAAGVGKAFGMKVIAWSQSLTPDRAKEHGAEYVSKDDLFRNADFLSVHMQLSDRTRGLIGAKELGLMKPNRLRGEHVARTDHRRADPDCRAECQAHRRCRPRRVRCRAATSRSSLPPHGQRRDNAAPRLRESAEL